MTADVGSLQVSLALETARFTQGLGEAQRALKTHGDRMEAAGKRIGESLRAIGSVAVTAGIGLAARALKDMAVNGLEFAGSLGEQAQQLGVTTSELQRYRFIASQVGIDQAVMDKGLSKLSISLGGLANGAKLPTKALEQLGLSTTQIASVSQMTAGQAIPYLADAFAKLKSPTEQASIAAELFGAKMGGKFLTLLTMGSGGINDLSEAYRKLNIELSPAQIANADAAADKYTALQKVLEAQQGKIAADNADGILKGMAAWENLKINALKVMGETSSALSTFNDKYYSHYVAWADGMQKQLNRTYASYVSWVEGIRAKSREAVSHFEGMVSQIGRALGSSFGSIMDQAKGKFAEVKAAAFDMWDKVTRRSYVPDMIDDIAREMGRLDSVMVNPAKNATAATKAAFKAMAEELQPVLDQLFPEGRALIDYRKQVDVLERGRSQGKISDATAQEGRIRAGGGAPSTVLDNLTADGGFDFGIMDRAQAAMREFGKVANDNAAGIDAANVRIAESFKDMADKTLSAVQNLAGAIKGGGFLDILGAVIGLGMQLGKIGAFGKGVSTKLNAIPGRAMGGPILSGQAYMVGERGPELIVPGKGGTVIPNHELGGRSQGNTYNIQGNLMTPDFWAQIHAGDVGAARAGATMGVNQMNYRQGRRVA